MNTTKRPLLISPQKIPYTNTTGEKIPIDKVISQNEWGKLDIPNINKIIINKFELYYPDKEYENVKRVLFENSYEHNYEFECNNNKKCITISNKKKDYSKFKSSRNITYLQVHAKNEKLETVELFVYPGYTLICDIEYHY